MLEVQSLHKAFGPVNVINGVDLRVPQGQRHAVIGPNGAGKTTLFHLLSGNYRPDRGRILFKGKDISAMSPHSINRLGLARSFQITNVFKGLTVLENVRVVVLSRLGVRFNFWSRVDAMEQANQESLEILELIGLTAKKEQMAGQMAYGEQRALEIGLALASNPSLVLLDEPTAGMSIDETREAVRLIDRVTKGKTLMIIEHDMEVVFTLADLISVIYYGEVLACGTPEEIRGHPKVREAYLGSRISC